MKILDHGYIKLIEHWGSDERVIESARMSTGKGFNGWGSQETPGDEKLLRFLWENKHSTPFEMAGAIFEVKAPIFVYREWHRHRTQSFNEMSARYVPLPDENYVPTVGRMLINSKTNKQAGVVAGSDVLDLDSAVAWLAELADVYDHAERVYQSGLRRGVPKELARLPVPVARYSRMRASANLRNWLQFLALRSTVKNPAAQWEIRQFADALGTMLAEVFPRTMALFAEDKYADQRKAFATILARGDLPEGVRAAIEQALTGTV